MGQLLFLTEGCEGVDRAGEIDDTADAIKERFSSVVTAWGDGVEGSLVAVAKHNGRLGEERRTPHSGGRVRGGGGACASLERVLPSCGEGRKAGIRRFGRRRKCAG
jgi:hypothetical protein